MAQFTDFDAYREAYFADTTANGPTAHPTGSAQQFGGQLSSQDAGGFDVFSFNQSALGDGAFDGLVSNSAGVSGTGYIPGVEDMRTFAQLGSGRELSSLQGLAHDPSTSQYTQNDIQTGRNRSWSASSRESTMSATGNGSATLFPTIPPDQYFSASPNISSIVPPESGTSRTLQGPYASHAEILQQQQRSSPISSVPTQPKRMSTALRKRLAAVQQPQQAVPSLASTTRGQFAAPSMLLPVEPGQKKRRAHEPESDDPGLDTSSQRSRRGAGSGQSTKRQRRGSAPSVEEAQLVDQMTRSTPFTTPLFAPAFQLDAAVATGPYYTPEFPLAPMPEQHDHALDAISAQQLPVQEPSAHDLPGSKTGSRRNLSVKMRQELARRKAAREADREARHPASDDEITTPFAPFNTLFASEQHAPTQTFDPSAGQSSKLEMPTNEYSVTVPMDDWLGRALSEGQHKMVNAGGGDASADWYKQATNPDAMSSGSSSKWEAGTITPGPNGQVFFDPRFAGDYDYDGNLDLHLDFVSVPLSSTPLEAKESFGGHGGPSHTNPAAVPDFESSRCEHGMCPSSGCPSHATAHLHSQAFGDYDFAPSSAFVDNEGDGDDLPIAESSKAGAKRASTSRARGKNKTGSAKRGRRADAPAGGAAPGNTPKSSGSRVQKANKFTPANPPRLPAQLPEIVQGHTPCPFCQHPIRTALKNSVLPSMCQVKEHLFGYNDNPPCPALVYWLVSWPKGGDLVGVAIIGEIIVRQWPDEVKGTDEEEWFPYRMWGKKTGFGGELLKWWNGLSQERKDEILGKGKGE